MCIASEVLSMREVAAERRGPGSSHLELSLSKMLQRTECADQRTTELPGVI